MWEKMLKDIHRRKIQGHEDVINLRKQERNGLLVSMKLVIMPKEHYQMNLIRNMIQCELMFCALPWKWITVPRASPTAGMNQPVKRVPSRLLKVTGSKAKP